MNLSNIVHREFKTESDWGYSIEEIMELVNQLDLQINREEVLKSLDGVSFAISEDKEVYTHSDVYSLLKDYSTPKITFQKEQKVEVNNSIDIPSQNY